MTKTTSKLGEESNPDPVLNEITETTLEGLELVLMELSENEQRRDAVPQWEFCEGLMTAILCMRRPVHDDEWLPLLLDQSSSADLSVELFDSPGQQTRFMMHWRAREAQLRHMLDAYLDDLEVDAPLLAPAMMDWAGLAHAVKSGKIDLGDTQPLPDAGELKDMPELPSYGQVWAAGFMFAVSAWPDDWQAPRDKLMAFNWEDALDCVRALIAADTDPPVWNMVHDEASPSVSEQRVNAVGEALLAVHDLYVMAKNLGPRIQPLERGEKIGRNDPCPCGSGKKYKKCCAD